MVSTTELKRPAIWIVVLTFCSQSTDRCYTCSTDEPFCHWQTYIDTNSPALSWFSCVTSQLTDETFYAATITNNLLSSQTTSSSSATLPVGGIVGVAVGGTIFLILCVALVVYFCFKRRNHMAQEQRGFNPWRRYPARQNPHEMPTQLEPTELDSYSAGVEEVQSYYHQGAWKPRQPIAELPGGMAVTSLNPYPE